MHRALAGGEERKGLERERPEGGYGASVRTNRFTDS
jgi:hypothetical protein